MGRHMRRLLKFVIDYPGWHTMSQSDEAAQRAMKRLAELGFIEVVRHAPRDYQFRLLPPAYERKEQS